MLQNREMFADCWHIWLECKKAFNDNAKEFEVVKAGKKGLKGA